MMDSNTVLNHTLTCMTLSEIQRELIYIFHFIQDDEFTKDLLLERMVKVIERVREEESFHFGVLGEHFEEKAKSLNNTLAGR
ncbi:hypothetical protein [Paenibacillus polymyxa]|uniref:hypothetical protein n=1 Tax=Paenibacillus polymyxa TaxID=1406 RepID=UPI000845EDA1|nr:hypothetical protein [Paenibacillus polymyxa]AOK91976.1 hypothetical protein AOU00_20435 [Paenibacillus polymyxa]